MKDCKIYLAGPIFGKTDEECMGWREKVKKHFTSCLDPMDRDYRGQENDMHKLIVEQDKRDIENCEFVIANTVIPSAGTSMEIIFADSCAKQVISIVKDVNKTSPWIRYHSVLIVDSVEKAIDAVNKIIDSRLV